MMSEINVVPYIDVMLVLLIIFMITTPLLSTGVEVDLPAAGGEPVADSGQEPFVVTVDAGGRYYLNDDVAQVQSERDVEIKARAVLQRNPALPFLVRGDGSADYRYIVEAMVLLQRAGVQSVGLVTDPAEPGAN